MQTPPEDTGYCGGGGGRLSRRNTISESLYSPTSRRSASTSVTNSANNSGDYPAIPAMLASYEASRNGGATHPPAPTAAAVSPSPSPSLYHQQQQKLARQKQQQQYQQQQQQQQQQKPRPPALKDISRQNSSEDGGGGGAASKSSGCLSVSGSESRVPSAAAGDGAAAAAAPAAAAQQPQHHKVKVKLRRKVSFTERDPIIIDDGGRGAKSPSAVAEAVSEDGGRPLSSASTASEPKQSSAAVRRRPRKEKSDRPRRPRSKRDRSTESIKEERRKSQPLGEELFEQVSSRLKAIEKEQMQQEQTAVAEEEVELPDARRVKNTKSR